MNDWPTEFRQLFKHILVQLSDDSTSSSEEIDQHHRVQTEHRSASYQRSEAFSELTVLGISLGTGQLQSFDLISYLLERLLMQPETLIHKQLVLLVIPPTSAYTPQTAAKTANK